MNIFEKYGSYEAVRQAAENYKKSGDRVTAAGLELQCLEYRRQYNVYEDGDKIVFHKGKKDIWDFYTKSGIKPYDIAVCNSKFIKYTYAKNIRHATDEEIAAGRRL